MIAGARIERWCGAVVVIVACGDAPMGDERADASSTSASATTSSDDDGTGSPTTTAASSGTTTSTDSSASTGVLDDTTTLATASSTSDATGDPSDELLRVDFEMDAPGPYTEEMVAADFGVAPPWNDGLDEGRATIVDDATDRFLRITYPAGEYGPGDGGVQFQIALPEPHEELHLAYRVRFADGFEFVKGGKLPGLVGGSSPTGCVEDTDGFSARMMWRTDGEAVQYMYFPAKVNDCGDDYGYASDGTAVHFEPGTWHTVEHRLRMNTPGAQDGVLQAWFDGALALDEQAFEFRLVDGDYAIDALYFSTFFGGSDESWAPSTDQVLDVDDLVIATGPIGR